MVSSTAPPMRSKKPAMLFPKTDKAPTTATAISDNSMAYSAMLAPDSSFHSDRIMPVSSTAERPLFVAYRPMKPSKAHASVDTNECPLFRRWRLAQRIPTRHRASL